MNRLRLPVFPAYYLLILVLLYVPIGVLFLFSINDGIVLTFPLKGITDHWYRDMLDNHELLNALRNSAIVAVASSLLATALGTLASIALIRFQFRGKTLFMAIALMPLLIPFLILGVALLILFAALDVDRGLPTMIIAHTVVSLPYTLLILMSRLVGFDYRVEEAAQDLGASYPYTLWRVTLPLIWPAILASWLIAFTISVDEFVLASFLNGGQPTLPIFILGQLRFANRFPQVIALAVIVMLGSITLFLISDWLQRLGTQPTASRSAPETASDS